MFVLGMEGLGLDKLNISTILLQFQKTKIVFKFSSGTVVVMYNNHNNINIIKTTIYFTFDIYQALKQLGYTYISKLYYQTLKFYFPKIKFWNDPKTFVATYLCSCENFDRFLVISCIYLLSRSNLTWGSKFLE